jgi:hypothetical protein
VSQLIKIIYLGAAADRRTPTAMHTFEETIGGRTFTIEVQPAGEQWRAQLRRSPGTPTAMMPFYGASPEAASALLADWLKLANQRRMAKASLPAPSSATRTA